MLLDTFLKEIMTLTIDPGRFAVHAEQVNVLLLSCEVAAFSTIVLGFIVAPRIGE